MIMCKNNVYEIMCMINIIIILIMKNNNKNKMNNESK